jgi:hypothetical protein
VSIVLDKALEERHFRQMYAKLCHCIVVKGHRKEFQDKVDPGQKVTFKTCLHEMNETIDLDAAAKANKTCRCFRVARVYDSYAKLGNIKLSRELFAQKILKAKIMHCCE